MCGAICPLKLESARNGKTIKTFFSASSSAVSCVLRELNKTDSSLRKHLHNGASCRAKVETKRRNRFCEPSEDWSSVSDLVAWEHDLYLLCVMNFQSSRTYADFLVLVILVGGIV